MCYSAQVQADYRKYQKLGGKMSLKDFVELWLRDPFKKQKKPKTPKAMEDAFGSDTPEVRAEIDAWNAAETTELEQELFKQKKRLGDAERTLQTKTTKKAQEDQRIATNKINQILGWLSDLKRREPMAKDSRMYPGWYVPVMISEGGQRTIKPMRYQCRPAGKPSKNDFMFPGTYNARRDSLGNYWKGLFGFNHAVMIVTAIYENVSRHTMEHRELAPGEKEENLVLEFKPEPEQEMYIACLYSHWVDPAGKEPDLWSFAAVTDDPPAEVAAAGHDRMIIQIKPENLEAWLNPDPSNLAAMQAILDDRPQVYYRHRLDKAA